MSGCLNSTAQFTDLSTGAVSWSWNFGDGNVSSSQNPNHMYQFAGQFSVSLIISDALGCSANFTTINPIVINPPSPPIISEIIVATVTSNNSVSILWNPSTSTDFSHYIIFRKDLVSGLFNSIGTVSSQNITSFTDNNVNTIQNSYCYKIQTFDLCGTSLPIDSSLEHCTVNITAIGIGQNIQVSWNAYVGATVNNYKIYRIEQGNTFPTLLAIVAPNITSITDTTIYCPLFYSYRVKACDLNGNPVVSNSDTSIAKPNTTLLANQVVEIVRSTVVENKSILTEWKAPSVLPLTVFAYNIYRSTDSIYYDLITTIAAEAFAFMDNDVDVQNQNYYYKIEAQTICGPSGMSNLGSSILLKAKRIDQEIELSWTGYEGWDTGVDYYIIEKMNDDGTWKTINVVDRNTLKVIDK